MPPAARLDAAFLSRADKASQNTVLSVTMCPVPDQAVEIQRGLTPRSCSRIEELRDPGKGNARSGKPVGTRSTYTGWNSTSRARHVRHARRGPSALQRIGGCVPGPPSAFSVLRPRLSKRGPLGLEAGYGWCQRRTRSSSSSMVLPCFFPRNASAVILSSRVSAMSSRAQIHMARSPSDAIKRFKVRTFQYQQQAMTRMISRRIQNPIR